MTLFSTPSQVTTVHLFFLTNHPNLACQSESYFSSDMLKEVDEAPSDAPEQTPNYPALLMHPNIDSSAPTRSQNKRHLRNPTQLICRKRISAQSPCAHRCLASPLPRSANLKHYRNSLPPTHHVRLQSPRLKLDSEPYTISPSSRICDDVQRLTSSHSSLHRT
jgi:hypothetical protein